jgi:hypothetical protein
VVDGKSGNQTAWDFLRAEAGALLPGVVGDRVGNRLGKPTGVVAEGATNVAISPEHSLRETVLDMAHDQFHEGQQEKHNKTLSPDKRDYHTLTSYSGPSHDDEKQDGE